MAGVAPPLVALLSEGRNYGKQQVAADLTGLSGFGGSLGDASVMAPLVACLKNGSEEVPAAAALLLAAVLKDNNDDRRVLNAAVEAFVWRPLAVLLALERSATAQAAGATAIGYLWLQDAEKFFSLKAQSQLLELLLRGADSVRVPAARALSNSSGVYYLFERLPGILLALVDNLSSVSDAASEAASVLLAPLECD